MLKRFPTRRLELLSVLLVIMGLLGMGWLARGQDTSIQIALLTMEFFLPLLMGIVTAGLLADDPALELLLTAPRPATDTLAERSIVMLLIASLVGATVQMATSDWAALIPAQGVALAFTWLSPLLFYCGAAGTGAMLRGRMLDGVILCFSWASFSIISMPLAGIACQEEMVSLFCSLSTMHPLLTLVLPGHPTWPANRLLWVALGVLMIWTSLRLARCEERILRPAPEE